MKHQNKQVDTYIEKAEPFALIILKHLRALIHKACPEAEETIKWGFPHFMYKGILCSMAGFKKHCAFVFWKANMMKDPHQFIHKSHRNSMGHFGRITQLEDLPSDDILISYIKQAMKLNDEKIKPSKKAKTEKQELSFPSFFLDPIKENKKALQTFLTFSYSKKKDYLDWILDAKKESTKQKRLALMTEWLEQGKSRNWKYENE